MTNDFAVDPQATEAGLPDEWREHVRELRSENARRRKENQELRAQLAALSADAEQAQAAQAAAAQHGERESARLATVGRRLKELEVARLAREALRESVAQRTAAGGGATGSTAEGGCATRLVDLSRAQRLLERLPLPLDLDADALVDDEGRVALEPAAGERLKGFIAEVVDLLAVEPRAAAPPVGGEPPRLARTVPSPTPNAWDAGVQRTPTGKARAALREAAAAQARTLDEVVQL